MSTVSVVIPCYNYGHYLEDAVASVVDEQVGVDVKVLIIDDASTDDSAEFALKLAARDPRVEVVVHETNKGHIATYNEGLLEWADGDYCVLLSADDRLTPGSLQRAAGLLDAHPSVGFVYGNLIRFNDGCPPPAARTKVRAWSVWAGTTWLETRFRHARTGITSPEAVVRTSLQKRVGAYDSRLPHLADEQMWLRLAANADVGHLRGVDQAYYRRHGHNMSTTAVPLFILYEYRRAFESALDSCRDRLPDQQRLSDLIHRKLASDALLAAARAYDRGRSSETPVDELVSFALDCWPRAKELTLYRTLQLRRRIGPRAVPYFHTVTVPIEGARRAGSWWDRGSGWNGPNRSGAWRAAANAMEQLFLVRRSERVSIQQGGLRRQGLSAVEDRTVGQR